MTPKMCLANFSRFCHDEAIVRYVVAEYARLRGWDPQRSVDEALVAYREFWSRIERKEELKRRHKSLAS